MERKKQMKKVAFIGAYDKTDCMLYVAKILQATGKKVLVVDSTINQKARYVVPTITPTVSYVTEFEEIDVAVGFTDMVSISRYLCVPEGQEPRYDFVLIDVDSAEVLERFKLKQNEKNYFVTGFDLFSLKKGLEILMNLSSPINLKKVLYSKDMTKEEDDYLNYLSTGYKANWDEDKIYFPLENGDASAIAENQRVSRIKFRNISAQYKDGLMYIAEELLGDSARNSIRRAMKNLEKGV
jgi:hypothetical protein